MLLLETGLEEDREGEPVVVWPGVDEFRGPAGLYPVARGFEEIDPACWFPTELELL